MTTIESTTKVYPDLNTDLLRKVFAAVEADPEHHNPTYWATQTLCGTSFCFAGQTLHLVGKEFAWHDPSPWQVDFADAVAEQVSTDDGEWVWVGDAAEELLGLTGDEANDLFDFDNSIEDLRGYVDRLLAGERWGSSETVTGR